MLSPTFSMKCIWTTSILCLEYASPALLLIFLTTEIWFRIQNLGQFLPFSGNFVFSKYYHIPCTLCGRLHFPKMTVTIALIPQALFTVWLWLWALLPLKNRINVPSPGNWVSLYCGSNAILWFHRLGHKRQYSFCLVLLGHSLLKPKMLHGQSNEASVNSQSKLPNEWASLEISPAFTSSQLRSENLWRIHKPLSVPFSNPWPTESVSITK